MRDIVCIYTFKIQNVLSLECCFEVVNIVILHIMSSQINIIFGKIVAQNRKAKGISQSELAYLCGLHRTYIGAIERGEKSPTLVTIEKIANGLNLSISDIWAALKTN